MILLATGLSSCGAALVARPASYNFTLTLTDNEVEGSRPRRHPIVGPSINSSIGSHLVLVVRPSRARFTFPCNFEFALKRAQPLPLSAVRALERPFSMAYDRIKRPSGQPNVDLRAQDGLCEDPAGGEDDLSESLHTDPATYGERRSARRLGLPASDENEFL
ncbi:unnamed protein product [Trichogramma brassicae]|uniref:Uncharacterized protein n=1 Tax=Trichogramma brassicae TaxID=86971 RepID=A0A6H5HXS5_9HYME|nr:unnamed protein product [Trichogramma brassicae]